MKETSKSLAVVMPVFNGEAYLAEMLDSVMAQTYSDWQLIVVDDGSTDATLPILEDYSKKDDRIKVVSRPRPPKGAQTCRNTGLELTEGAEYVIFFDADDVVAPYCFEQRVKYMKKNPELDFAIFPARTFSEHISNNRDTYYGVKFLEEDDLCSFFWGKVPFVVWNNIYRRSSIVRQQLFWDERLLSRQDADFNIQAILKGLKYKYAESARIDYYYRMSASSSISKDIKSMRHQESHLYLLLKILDSLSEGQKSSYRMPLNNYVIEFTRFFVLNKSWQLFSQLLQHPWVKGQKGYTFRLKLFFVLLGYVVKSGHSHYSDVPTRLLFPSIYKALKSRRAKYVATVEIFAKNVFES